MKKERVKLVITKTDKGYSAYDEYNKTSIDVFPATKDGQERLVQYLCTNLLNVDIVVDKENN